MKYKFNDDLIEGSTPDEIVTALRSGSRFGAGPSLRSFMEGMAKREREYSGHQLRTTTTQAFVEDLLRYNLLRTVD